MIDKIELCGLVPEVFARENPTTVKDSGIWLSDKPVSFSRGCRQLIESASGQGKSSLISFIYGRRTDYRGMIAFDGTDIRGLDSSRWIRNPASGYSMASTGDDALPRAYGT